MLKRGVEATLSRGLEQWLWFLGVDVRHPEGNLLVRNGFRKFKLSNTKGSSRYQLNWNGNLIELHSFCVGVYSKSTDGFIFIRARNRCFLFTDHRPPCPGDYPEDCIIAPDTHELTYRFHAVASTFLGWLEEYEQWVDYTYGATYRTACYEAYHLKWQPPTTGRDWFNCFRDQMHKTEAVKSVEAYMKLLETNNASK